ncbi:MAG: HAD family hydrolase [Candidatus Methanofastidiosia archaeon]
MSIYNTFLFDLDGTLVTMEMDFFSLRKRIEKILISYGFPEDKVKWKEGTGTIDSLMKFKREMKEMGLDATKTYDELNAFIYDYELQQAVHTRPINGAIETLEYLKHKNYKIAIVTRNNKESSAISIKNAGISSLIDTLITREDAKKLKPHPEQFEKALKALNSLPQNSIVVGDYYFEMVAGKKLGCLTIGVLTGTGDEKCLKDADIILPSVAELKKLF